MPTKTTVAIALLALVSLAGCSAQQGYASAQAWKRNQCTKIIDAQERIRCLRETDVSYDRYKKEEEAATQKPE